MTNQKNISPLYDIFVFAGQSNMMGASYYPPKEPVYATFSAEYKHAPKRRGAAHGVFYPAGYPVGEFSYTDIKTAEAPENLQNGKSLVADYRNTTYFCPAMSSSDGKGGEIPFSARAEATIADGVTLAPFLAEEWEKRGYAALYAHIAKGGVGIAYYFDDAMAEEYHRRMTAYNAEHGTKERDSIPPRDMFPGAAAYFREKCEDMFIDAEVAYGGRLSGEKCFFWLQGEADAGSTMFDYKTRLSILWERLREIGFTRFFVLRVDYFGSDAITEIMRAEEEFCTETANAYMLTRVPSFFPYAGRDESAWFISQPPEEYTFCRDSFYGNPNQHINEKGFRVIARHAAPNLYRVLREKREPIPEPELITDLIAKKENNT